MNIPHLIDQNFVHYLPSPARLSVPALSMKGDRWECRRHRDLALKDKRSAGERKASEVLARLSEEKHDEIH